MALADIVFEDGDEQNFILEIGDLPPIEHSFTFA